MPQVVLSGKDAEKLEKVKVVLFESGLSDHILTGKEAIIRSLEYLLDSVYSENVADIKTSKGIVSKDCLEEF